MISACGLTDFICSGSFNALYHLLVFDIAVLRIWSLVISSRLCRIIYVVLSVSGFVKNTQRGCLYLTGSNLETRVGVEDDGLGARVVVEVVLLLCLFDDYDGFCFLQTSKRCRRLVEDRQGQVLQSSIGRCARGNEVAMLDCKT